MSKQERIEVKPRLTYDEKRYLFACLLRNPLLFQLAVEHLQPELVDPVTDMPILVLWRGALNASKASNTLRLPDDDKAARILLELETGKAAEQDQVNVRPEHIAELFGIPAGPISPGREGLIEWVYSLEQSEVIEEHGKNLLLQFLEERLVYEELRRLGDRVSSPLVPSSIQPFLDRIDQHRSKLQGLISPRPGTPILDLSSKPVIELHTTGSSFMDRFMGGGQAYGEMYTVMGSTGCLTGDTIIGFNICKKSFTCTLREAYLHWHGGDQDAVRGECLCGCGEITRIPSHNDISKNQVAGIPLRFIYGHSSCAKRWPTRVLVRAYRGENGIGLHTINNIVKSGVKVVYELTLVNGLSIRGTADHLILTSLGWTQLSLIKPGVMVLTDRRRPIKTDSHKSKPNDRQIWNLWKHPYGRKVRLKDARGYSIRIPLHIAVWEAATNNLSLDEYTQIMRVGDPNGLVLVDPTTHVVHHKDKNHDNNDPINLQLMTILEHYKHHGHEHGYHNFGNFTPLLVEAASVRECGEEMTYDICCDQPYHNFVANGIVVHNSGKTMWAAQVYMDGALEQQRLHEVEGRVLGHWHYFCLEMTQELKMRIWSHAAQVDVNTFLENKPLSTSADQSTFKDYEHNLFQHNVVAGGQVMGERERLADAEARWLRFPNFVVHDYSGAQPGIGGGGVAEMARILDQEEREGRKVAGIIIDYAGLVVSRMIESGRAHRDDEYKLLNGFGQEVVNRICARFNCVAWVLHQLHGETAKRAPTAKYHHADAKGARNFADASWFAFQIGNKDEDTQCVTIWCTKSRRTKGTDKPALVRIDGAMATLVDEDARYTVSAVDRGRIVPKGYEQRIVNPSRMAGNSSRSKVPQRPSVNDAS